MTGTSLHTRADWNTNIFVDLAEESGLVRFGSFIGSVPTDQNRYAIGCLLVSDATGFVYSNQGTVANPNFVQLGAGGGGDPTIGNPVIGGTPGWVLYIDQAGNLVGDNGFTRSSDTFETKIHQIAGDFTQGFDLGTPTIGSLVGTSTGNILSREVSTGLEGKASIGVFDGAAFGYDTVGAGSFVTDSTGQVALSYSDTTNGIRWSYFDSSLTVGSDGGLTPVGVQFGASDNSTYWNKMWLSKDAPAFIGSELPGSPATFTRAWFTPTTASIGNPDTAKFRVDVPSSTIDGTNLQAWTNPTPSFSGTGNDDIILIGSYTGLIGTQFTLTITSVNNQNVSYTSLSGGSFNVGDTISNGSGVTGTVTLDYGSGFYLTNVTGGQFAPSDPLDNGLGVTATAQGVSAVYDLYDWSDTEGNSGSGATDGQTLLALGISANFGAATGHVIGDEWTWTYSALYLTIGRMFDFDGIDKTLAIGDADSLFSGYGVYGNVDTGLFRIGSSAYDFMTLDLATPYFRLQNSTGDSLLEYQTGIGRLGLNYAGVNTFEYDGSGFQFRLGDLTGTTYNSSLVYDWVTQSLTMSQDISGSTRYPLRITKPGGNTKVELGDPTGGGNGTSIIIDDGTGLIENKTDAYSSFVDTSGYELARFDALNREVTFVDNGLVYNGNWVKFSDSDNEFRFHLTSGGNGLYTVESGSSIVMQYDAVENTMSTNYGVINQNVTSVNYGTTTNLTSSYYHLAIGSSGSGATTFNLPASPTIGREYIFSDIGGLSGTNNITIDAGSGKVIVSQTNPSGSQTFSIAGDGVSVTLKYLEANTWMVTSNN